MPNVFPTFKTAFVDGIQTAKLAFAKMVGKAEDPNEPDLDDLILIDFSRPNVGATSGATVYDQNGLIVELAANDPDWSYASDGTGCQVVRMRPQTQSLISNNKTPANWYNVAITPTVNGPFELDASANWGKYTQTAAGQNFGLYTPGITIGQKFTISTFIKISQSGNFIGIRETGNGVGVVRISDGTIFTAGAGITSVEVHSTIDPDIKRLVIYGTSGTGGNIFFVLTDSLGSAGGNDGNSIQITAFQIHTGNVDGGPILTSGSNLTRASNNIHLTDLITSGLFGVGGVFSFRLLAENYKSGEINGDNSILFKTSGNTNVIALWGLDTGFTAYDSVDTAYVDNSVKLTDFIITWNGQDLKVYDSTGLRSSYSFAASHILTQIVITSGDNYYDLKPGNLNITPEVISEAEAIEILS